MYSASWLGTRIIPVKYLSKKKILYGNNIRNIIDKQIVLIELNGFVISLYMSIGLNLGGKEVKCPLYLLQVMPIDSNYIPKIICKY